MRNVAAEWRETGDVATIEIRDLPEAVYEIIQRPARAADQRIEEYLRDQVVELARHQQREDAWAMVESALAGETHPVRA